MFAKEVQELYWNEHRFPARFLMMKKVSLEETTFLVRVWVVQGFDFFRILYLIKFKSGLSHTRFYILNDKSLIDHAVIFA